MVKRYAKTLVIFAVLTALFAVSIAPVAAMGSRNKKAILVAAFGTTYPSALKAILNVYNVIKKAYPNTEVRLAFTSNMIRRVWHKRQKDKMFQKEHPEIPNQIYSIRSPLAALAELSDAGYKTVVVQPLHVSPGEEYNLLAETIKALLSISTLQEKKKFFKKIALGRPLLGRNGPYKDGRTYHDDIKEVAKALKCDVDLARKNKSALVYMAHGNEHFSLGSYMELQKVMNQMYPDVKIFIGCVEGFPGIDEVVEQIKAAGVKKVILKPLMVVAGDHANNDMASDEEDSWKMILKRNGIIAKPVIQGIGELKSIAHIYLEHLKDAARDAGIQLK